MLSIIMDENMNIKNYKKSIAFAMITACLGFASAAQAGIVTDSFTNNFATTEIYQSGTLNKFDASLGTLTSATLTLSGESRSHTSLTNNAAQSQKFQFTSGLNFYFDASSVGVTIPDPAFSTSLGETAGRITLDGGESIVLGDAQDGNSFSITITGQDLLAFIGSGTFTTICDTLSTTTFAGGGGNIIANQSTTARCEGDISYSFSDVVTPPPTTASSPTTVLLFGAGLIGLMGTRRFLR